MLAMTALSGADYAALSGLLALFVGLPMTLVLFAIRAVSHRVDTFEQRTHERIDVVEAQVRDAGKTKVDKLDYLREIVSTRQKLDGMANQLAAIGQRLDDEFGLGAAINRLADEMGQLVKGKGDG